MDLAQFWNNSGGYQIEQSLRFNSADSARLYRTLAASQTRTYSFWYKYANLSGGNMYLFHHKNSGDTNYLGVRSGGSPSENQWQTLNQGSSFTEIASSRKYRDPSAWQHVVWKCTSTNVTMYVNGVEFASAGGANTSLSGGTLEIGARGSAEYFGGYIAEFHFVDGTAYNPSDFGETDLTTGAWIPKRFGGTYGANGVYLKFDPTATNGIGHDHSGNGNNFTATGFTTSGTGTDVMSDSPTTNWCTLNPLTKDSNTTLSEGNLRAVGSSSTAYSTNTQATFAQSSGKWYYETTYVSTSSTLEGIGWARTSLLPTSNPTTNGCLFYRPNQGDYFDLSGNNPTTPPTTSTSTVIQVAIDFDAGKIWFGSGGTWFNSGDPAAGSNEAMTFTGGAEVLSPCVRALAATFDFNFGQRAFSFTPPTGYKALNTANLPEPTIKNGRKYFDTVLYTGNGGTQTLSTLNFSPDLVWIKSRSVGYNHQLTDSVRGTGKELQSDLTGSETSYGLVSALNSNGFTVFTNGTYLASNANGTTYAAWCWDAGGTGSSNNAGTITSTVSANPTAGFSIVTYTGTGSAVTVGHGLGVAPAMVIVKDRSTNPGYSWYVYHQKLTSSSYFLRLNTTGAETFSNDPFNGTAPTSTVFSVGGENVVNTHNYVAYCFSEVAGYSKFGSYVGNGSSDGPAIWCGFRPAWVLIKSSSASGESWILEDSTRDTYNPAARWLYPNYADAESNGLTIDFLSNGFKLRISGTSVNTSSATYVFACFAELPFKYANAR